MSTQAMERLIDDNGIIEESKKKKCHFEVFARALIFMLLGAGLLAIVIKLIVWLSPGQVTSNPNLFPDISGTYVNEYYSKMAFNFTITRDNNELYQIVGVGYQYDAGVALYGNRKCLDKEKFQLRHSRAILESECDVTMVMKSPDRIYASPVFKWFNSIYDKANHHGQLVLHQWASELLGATESVEIWWDRQHGSRCFDNGSLFEHKADNDLSFLLFDEIMEHQVPNIVALLYRDDLYM